MTWWLGVRLAFLVLLVAATVVASLRGEASVAAWMWLGIASGYWMGGEPPVAGLELPRRRPGGGR